MCSTVACAQHAEDNAVRSAEDAFGFTVGVETTGLYNSDSVRGFSPQTAGNIRIDGLYFDQQGVLTNRVLEDSTVRVGITALRYPFPAPTGIVDYELREVRPDGSLSAIAYLGPFETHAAAIDGQIPTHIESLSIPLGIGYKYYAPVPGETSSGVAVGIAPQWKPNDRVTVRAFFDSYKVSDAKTQPRIYPQDAKPPPPIAPRYFGQSWTTSDTLSQNFGATVKATLPSNWTLSAGLFHSKYDAQTQYADQYFSENSQGFGDHYFVGYPDQPSVSTSGEIRATKNVPGAVLVQDFVIMVRGRDVQYIYGGDDVHYVGTASFQNVSPVSPPQFSYTTPTSNHSHLYSAGIAYDGNWLRQAIWSVGIQKEHYSDRVADPALPTVSGGDDPWRAYANGAVFLMKNLEVYAGYTQGLEDSGTAPANANNRGAVLPAARTLQRDAGLRLKIASRLSVIAGVFDVQKPYFNLAANGFFTELGQQRHRGIEMSIIADPTPELHILAGATISRPEVITNGLSSTPIGALAVGQPSRLAQLSVDYRLPALPSISLNATTSNQGSRAANVDNSVILPSRTLVGFGARYNFRIAGSDAMFRVQVDNVTNSGGWDLDDGGGYAPYPGRQFSAYLTVDR
jgi:iron complex outermembrane recepter protein